MSKVFLVHCDPQRTTIHACIVAGDGELAQKRIELLWGYHARLGPAIAETRLDADSFEERKGEEIRVAQFARKLNMLITDAHSLGLYLTRAW